MGKSNLLVTATEDLKELLGNGKTYSVPRYQRDYSWKQEHWEDLWEDLCRLEEQSSDHYMGAIVLQAEDRKSFKIIDGQQRVTTLSIFVLAAIDLLRTRAQDGDEAANNRQRAELLEASYIGARDAVSLRVESKLRLNHHDDAFYRNNLTQRVAPASKRTLRDSERLLWECFEFFRARLAEKFRERNGEAVAKFVERTEGLVFIAIRVEDELSAFTVFETLNARGLELSEPDLIKNFLLSLADGRAEHEIDDLLVLWNRVGDKVGTSRLPEFLRHHLNSSQPYLRKKELFKTIKRDIRDVKTVFALLNKLDHDADWYQALGDATSQHWLDFPGAAAQVKLLNLFNVTQYLPLALAAKDTLSPADLTEALRYCAVISVRFNGVAQKSTHALEDVYNEAALGLRSGKIKRLGALRKALAPIYVSDDEFEAAFSSLRLKASGHSRRRALYFLLEIERARSGRDMADETQACATVEHILPENPSGDWSAAFSAADFDRYVDRLANYALLEKSLNREAGNEGFGEKRKALAKSEYVTTSEIATTYEDWTREAIDARQRGLAAVAKTVWRLEI